MKYRVHRLEVKKDTAQEKLERFLNQLEGEVLAIVPYVTPTFQGMAGVRQCVRTRIAQVCIYRGIQAIGQTARVQRSS